MDHHSRLSRGIAGDRLRKALACAALAAGLAASFSASAQAQAEAQPPAEGQPLAEEKARNAVIADGVTTALGLAAGAAELNPLGPVLSIGMKAVVLEYAKTLPDTEQPAAFAAASSVWSGAAANNLCVTAAILSGGSFAPACIVLGVAWGMKAWKQTEHERTFWEGCAMLRQYANQPDLKCIYTPPQEAVAAAAETRVVTAAEVDAP